MFRPIDLETFNGLARDDAEERLYESFADRSWATRVAGGRPYPGIDALLKSAEDAWAELRPGDWLRAFEAHPRIGEIGGHAPATSESEQTGVRRASAATLSSLAAENRRYEDRFGHVFLIAARGRSAEDILQSLRVRMRNDPGQELEVAASEQRKITRQRLLAMLGA